MRKYLGLFLVVLLFFAFVACDGEGSGTKKSTLDQAKWDEAFDYLISYGEDVPSWMKGSKDGVPAGEATDTLRSDFGFLMSHKNLHEKTVNMLVAPTFLVQYTEDFAKMGDPDLGGIVPGILVIRDINGSTYDITKDGLDNTEWAAEWNVSENRQEAGDEFEGVRSMLEGIRGLYSSAEVLENNRFRVKWAGSNPDGTSWETTVIIGFNNVSLIDYIKQSGNGNGDGDLNGDVGDDYITIEYPRPVVFEQNIPTIEQ